MPETLGLSVHLTPDMNGLVRFEPDTLSVHTVNNSQEFDNNSFYEKGALNFKHNPPENLNLTT